jgi:hypothetical protein
MNKYNFEIRIRTHCSGCGLSKNISNIIAPVSWDKDERVLDMLRAARHRLDNCKCPTCEKAMDQVQLWPDYSPQDPKTREE